MDIRIRLEREELQGCADDVFGFLEHLALSNPQRRLSNSAGEIVDFNPIELTDLHLYRRKRTAEIELPLAGVQLENHLVF